MVKQFGLEQFGEDKIFAEDTLSGKPTFKSSITLEGWNRRVDELNSLWDQIIVVQEWCIEDRKTYTDTYTNLLYLHAKKTVVLLSYAKQEYIQHLYKTMSSEVQKLEEEQILLLSIDSEDKQVNDMLYEKLNPILSRYKRLYDLKEILFGNQ